LCQAFVTGPEDCQTVALVMDDPELRAELAALRLEYMRKRRAEREAAREPSETAPMTSAAS